MIILTLALCVPFAASAESADVPTVIDAQLHFRPIQQTHGVEFRWFRWSKPKDFVSYEIRRADDQAAAKIVEAASTVAATTNRYSTNFSERLDKGVYFYRLCIVTKTKRICSANKAVTIKIGLPEGEKKKLALTEEPVVKINEAPAGQLTLRVDRDIQGNAILSWTPMDASLGIKFYKPVRSQNNPNLSYPNDGYLAHVLDLARTSYVDRRTPQGTTFYRVCAVSLQNQVYCGNVAVVD